MDNHAIPSNGAYRPDPPDPRVQELMRQNQDLQQRLAEAVQEKDQLRQDLEKVRARYADCRIMLNYYVMKEDPLENWENLHLEEGMPMEEILAEFKD